MSDHATTREFLIQRYNALWHVNISENYVITSRHRKVHTLLCSHFTTVLNYKLITFLCLVFSMLLNNGKEFYISISYFKR